MKSKQKGFSPLLAIIGVAILVVAAIVFLMTQKRNLQTGTQQTSENIPAIQDANGLNAVASELDNTDLNAVDKELNQLDLDTSTF